MKSLHLLNEKIIGILEDVRTYLNNEFTIDATKFLALVN